MAPLITVLTRTLGRPYLVDAAACVAGQTYRPIEWIVVDAAGRGLEAPGAGDVDVRVVGSGEPMLRSRAANFGLDHARGARALILDDDDLLLPDAIATLSAALDANPDARLAYGDVSVLASNPGPGPVGMYAIEYSELLLTLRNVFPPNAALFDLSLCRDHGVRFDVDLNWFEDWDFWLAISVHTRFVHVRQVTGVYRHSLSQSDVWNAGRPDADPRMGEQNDIVLARAADRRRRLRAELNAIKADAVAFAAAGRLPEAAALWRKAHELHHYDPEPYLGYAEIALAAGDLAAARMSLDNAVATLPDNPALRRAHAHVLELAGDHAGARAALERAEQIEAAHRLAPPITRGHGSVSA